MHVQHVQPDLDADRLRTLAAHRGPSLSAYAPVRVGDDAFIATQIRNCVRDARKVAPELAERLASEVAPLLGELPRWDKSQGGIALFIGDDVTEAAWVEQEVDRSVHVGERFHVTPFATHDGPGSFAVVALQLGEWSAYEVDGAKVSEVDAEEAPRDLKEANATVVSPVVGGASHAHRTSDGGEGATTVHPQGFGHEDRRKNAAMNYLRALTGPLEEAIGKTTPVVLVGNEPWIGMFARSTGLDVVGRVDRNPGALDRRELIDLARAQLAHGPSDEDLANTYAQANHRTDDPARIPHLAQAGGVAMLLLPEGWHPSLDAAVCDVLEHGGEVHQVDGGTLAGPAAVLRWPDPMA